MSQDAKNRRRAKPSGKIHSKAAKKSKRVCVQHRYIGPNEGAHLMFMSGWYSGEWQNWSNYPNIKAAEQAVKTMNRKDSGNREYRIKPDEKD